MNERTLSVEDNHPQRIQDLLDRCAASGGGRVIVPRGDWDIGLLRLPGRVHLRLEAGCTLQGQIAAEDAEDVGIVGDDARAVRIVGGVRLRRVRDVECRGYSGRLTGGDHIEHGRFSDLILHQPPQRQAEGSVVCLRWVRDLHFSDCDLESNDDVFCLKRAAEDITLTRSRLCGRMAAAWKIGTETDGLFRGIRFSDTLIENSDRAAISIESVDGSEIRDVQIENLRLRDCNSLLFIRLGARDRYGTGVGRIDGVTIAGIEGFGDAMDEGYGSCIAGLPGCCVENITLRDVRWTSKGGQPADLASRAVPEQAALYPEFDLFGRLPAHGLYARHVRGLRLEGVQFGVSRPDGRPAIVLEDVEGVEAAPAEPAPVVREAPHVAAPADLPAGDVEALRQALAAAQPGQTIRVAPGDYVIGREHLPLRIAAPGVTVSAAEGAGVTRIRATGAREDDSRPHRMITPDQARQADALFMIAADGVALRGFTLAGGVYNVYAGDVADCTVEGNRFGSAKYHQVYLVNGRGCRVVGNRTTSTLNAAVKLDGCAGCAVAGNTFDGDPGGVRLYESCRNEIQGNRFEAVWWYAVMLEHGSHGNRIDGNAFAGGRLTGIQVRGCDDTLITGNTFTGHKNESVLVDLDARGVRLRHNAFHGNRGLAVSNETPHAVDAIENWWGSPAGPGDGALVDARVTVTPWLTSPPPGPCRGRRGGSGAI